MPRNEGVGRARKRRRVVKESEAENPEDYPNKVLKYKEVRKRSGLGRRNKTKYKSTLAPPTLPEMSRFMPWSPPPARGQFH